MKYFPGIIPNGVWIYDVHLQSGCYGAVSIITRVYAPLPAIRSSKKNSSKTTSLLVGMQNKENMSIISEAMISHFKTLMHSYDVLNMTQH